MVDSLWFLIVLNDTGGMAEGSMGTGVGTEPTAPCAIVMFYVLDPGP